MQASSQYSIEDLSFVSLSVYLRFAFCLFLSLLLPALLKYIHESFQKLWMLSVQPTLDRKMIPAHRITEVE